LKTKTLYIPRAASIPLLVLLSWSFAIGQPLPGAVHLKKGVVPVEKNVATGQFKKNPSGQSIIKTGIMSSFNSTVCPIPRRKKNWRISACNFSIMFPIAHTWQK
jgi:hypothetical protein